MAYEGHGSCNNGGDLEIERKTNDVLDELQ
jgi:hypothetical protein